MGNYESRKVARDDFGDDFYISTAAVNDSSQPSESAIKHPAYNFGKLVIVQMYDTKEQAEAGHKRWVKLMTAKSLPSHLVDVSTAEIATLCDTFDSDAWRLKARAGTVGES